MKNSSIVVDSNLAIYSLIDTPSSYLANQVWKKILAEGANVFAPSLWVFETTSVIRKYCARGILTDSDAEEALIILDQMPVQFISDDLNLRRSALNWAARLRQSAAYDGFYLATAEKLRAEFWTADKALANNANQLGAGWVHWMGELA